MSTLWLIGSIACDLVSFYAFATGDGAAGRQFVTMGLVCLLLARNK